jgi:2-polyprenyl-3-methyl-5-hydroxy-6-metoxy-1,4-benzoquinol methylase
MIEIRSNESVLNEVFDLKGLRVADIGSGAGEMVRYMTRQGASVTGLECGELQLEKARSYPPEGDEVYLEGVGQEQPFDDNAFDAITFFNSLHHVPLEHMASALAEAKRVVKPAGTVYVAEPIASGSGFELHAPVDDETSVRTAAYDAIRNAAAHGLTQVQEVFYDTVYHYENFAAFKDDMIRIDPTRRAPFEAVEDDLRSAFGRLGVPEAAGLRFDQPMRVNVLVRR